MSSKAISAVEEVSAKGAFVRTDSTFRNTISSEPDAKYPAVTGRYHLYVANACPWAHRCLIVRAMKGLQDVISVSITHPTWQRTRPDDPDDAHCGWVFRGPEDAPLSNPTGHGSFSCVGCVPDIVNGFSTVRQLYDKAGFTGSKFTVPVLWDKETGTIVNNESSEIIRILNGPAFDGLARNNDLDLYPDELRATIDEVNDWVYHDVNNGVYKCGFAKSQEAYDGACTALFAALDRLEELLASQRFLAGDQFTEADVRAFVTLLRFDEVYVVYFKTNKAQIRDYPNLRNYVREVYQLPGVAETVNMDHIKMHYFTSHAVLNAFAVIPSGPNVLEDLSLPHDRTRFGKA